MIKKTRGEKIFTVINCLILLAFALTALYPFWYTLSISFSTTREVYRNGLHLFPREFSLTAYNTVFNNRYLGIAYLNTIFRTVAGTFLALLVSLMYAYALSRKDLPNKKLYTFILLLTMLFSGGKIPTYLTIKQIGLLNNRWVYVLPSLISAYNVIVARSFFMSIPLSLNESAKIDGASEFRIFFNIIIPLSKSVIMTLALWMAVAHWNAWYDAMMYVTDNKKIVLQLLLQRIIQENDSEMISKGIVNENTVQLTPETVKSATIVVSMLPILVAYPFVQKYFTKGVMLGAVKG